MRKYFNFLFLLICILGICSCKFEIENITRDKVLDYITVDVSGAKTSYVVDDTFTSKGIKVYGHYSDNSVELINNQYVSFEGFDSSKTNESLEIAAVYENKVDKFCVSIGALKIIRLRIGQRPSKIFYCNTADDANNADEELDLTGLQVYACYSDNDKGYLLNENEYSVGKLNTGKETGRQDIIVTYNGDPEVKSTYFAVYWNSYRVSGISIEPPKRKVYLMHKEDLDLTGLNVTLNYSNGIPPTTCANSECYSIQPADITTINEEGEYEIFVIVNGFRNSFKINIVNSAVTGATSTSDFNSLFFEGRKYNFDKDFEFYQLFENGATGERIRYDKVSQTTENETAIKYLKYSYNEDVGFDKAKNLNEPLEIKGNGSQTLYFYYKFYNILKQSVDIYKWSQKISVADSQMVGIKAVWQSDNAKGYPLGIYPDSSKKEYGSWKINAVLENGNEDIEIDPAFCHFEYVEDYNIIRKNLEGKDSVNTSVKVTYYDTRTKKTYNCIDNQVKVLHPALLNVKINTYPKTTYYVGEKLNFTDFKATGLLSDGNSIEYSLNSFASNLVSCDVDFNKVLAKENTEIKLTFNNIIQNEVVTIKIKVEDKNITGITIAKKIDSDLKYREGKKYSNEYFKNDFVVHPQYNFTSENVNDIINPDKITYELIIEENLTWRITAVYKAPDEQEYYTEYKKNDIKILGSLPVAINVTPLVDKTFNSLDDFIKNNAIKYTVQYKNGTKKEFNSITNGKFEDSIGVYTVSTSDGQSICISFTAKDKAVDESTIPTETFNVSIVKTIEIVSKNGTKTGFANCHSYNFKDYYDVNLVFSNGAKAKLANLDSVKFVLGDYNRALIRKDNPVESHLFAIYTDSNNKVHTATYNIKMYPALIKNITTKFVGGNDYSIDNLSKNILYTITYEDGFVEKVKWNGTNVNFENQNSTLRDYNFAFTDCNVNSSESSVEFSGTYIYYDSVNGVNQNEQNLINIIYDKLNVSVNSGYGENIVCKENTSSSNLKKIYTITREYNVSGFTGNKWTKDVTSTTELSIIRDNSSNEFISGKGKIHVKDGNLKETVVNNITVVPDITNISCNYDGQVLYYKDLDYQEINKVALTKVAIEKNPLFNITLKKTNGTSVVVGYKELKDYNINCNVGTDDLKVKYSLNYETSLGDAFPSWERTIVLKNVGSIVPGLTITCTNAHWSSHLQKLNSPYNNLFVVKKEGEDVKDLEGNVILFNDYIMIMYSNGNYYYKIQYGNYESADNKIYKVSKCLAANYTYAEQLLDWTNLKEFLIKNKFYTTD